MNSWAIALRLSCAFPCLGLAAESYGQTPVETATPHRELPLDLVAKLNPGQKQVIDNAIQAYREGRFADALSVYTQLLKDFPGDPVLAKFGAEDAIQSENPALAVALLKPVAGADPAEWQAAGILTRVCAESGDKTCRDAGMARILDLHSRSLTPPGLNQYVVETVKTGTNSLEINTSISLGAITRSMRWVESPMRRVNLCCKLP